MSDLRALDQQQITNAFAAFGRTMQPLLDQTAELIRNFGKWYEALPEDVKAQLKREAVRERVKEERCDCLCGHNHLARRGICAREAETSRLYEWSGGVQSVPFCSACAEATDAFETDEAPGMTLQELLGEIDEALEQK